MKPKVIQQNLKNSIPNLTLLSRVTKTDFTQKLFASTGGVRIFEIKNIHDEHIFVEHSEGYETVRPYFLIGGTESEERVEWIASFIDEDLEKLKPGLFIDFENTPIKVEFDWGPSWDGKLTREYVYFFHFIF